MEIKEQVLPRREPIPGFERYVITDFGEVTNLKTGRVLKSSLASGGDLKLNLAIDKGRSKIVYIKHAVIGAFIGKIPGDAIVIHQDHRRGNCRLPNLGWITQTECVYIVEDADGYHLVRIPVDVKHGAATGAWCRKGHRLSLNGQEDVNTLFWSGGRTCLVCAPNGLSELVQYSLQYGVGKKPPLPNSYSALTPPIAA
ncbi:hypothetical protein BH09ACT8_BH09ACT8_61490 [soil metagenome]